MECSLGLRTILLEGHLHDKMYEGSLSDATLPAFASKVLYLNRALINNSNIAEKATLHKEIHYYYDYYSYFHD